MNNIKKMYSERFNKVLLPLANNLEIDLKRYLSETKHIDRISVRAKSIERFVIKSEKISDGIKKYSDPLNQIQDQIGARIITLYLEDVEEICLNVKKYYKHIEQQQLIPESDNEFGYVGSHFIMLIPNDLLPEHIDQGLVPRFFELQVKTLFQHAFSEASHDLAYKASIQLTREQKRKVAFTAAQSWGADMIFAELFKELSINK